VLVDAVHLIEASVFEHGSDHAFEDVAQNLWGFKRFDLALVHWEVLNCERVLKVISDVLLGIVILLLVVEQAVVVEAEHAAHLGQELVFSQLQLGLMSIPRLVVRVVLVDAEVFNLVVSQIGLLGLREVPLEHREPHHVDVDHVVKDGIAEGL